MNCVTKFLDKHLPPAKYEDGTEAKCVFYRLCNVLDPIDD